MNEGKRKKKRLRNIICFAYCSLQLLIVLLAFHGVGLLFDFLGKEKTAEVHSAGIIFDSEPDEDQEEALFSVCLDAGHGGKDIGSDHSGRIEKDDNLKITQAVADYLSGQNVKVVLTRADDTFLKLSQRCDIANQNSVDYFISLHRNKGDGNGVETWIYSNATEKNMALAENIMSKLEEAGIQRNRGVKKGTQESSDKDYYINSHADMPACIIELGFMNNATDNSLFDEKLQDYAKAIGDAILMTYEQDTGNAAGANGSSASSENPDMGTGVPQTETPASEEPQEAWQPIENVESLSGSTTDWGQGSNVDENNRPVGAVSAQELYGSYQAYFIKEDTDKKIYLTFDEGYEYGFSGSILDTLKEKGVKAVFFVTEPYAKDQPDLVRRMIDEGHTLGNHSVTHPSNGLPSQSLDQQKNEVEENHQYVKDNFGYEMNLFRFPAGKFSEQSLAIVHNCGYKSVFWSFAYLDYDVNNQPDKTESLNKMVDKLHPGAIYLLHAESETNAAVLGEFIDRARAAGYEFELFR